MTARQLTVYDYQQLLDLGWRRSGCFLYRPQLKETCCPQCVGFYHTQKSNVT